MENNKKIYLGSDHAGFELKEKIKDFLKGLGYQYEDLGPKTLVPGDDYPDYAYLVAKQTAKSDSRGILICSSGVGMCITANKVKGIRAVDAYNVKLAQKSREHNNTNVLCIGQDYISPELAKEIIKTWLETDFSTEEKHQRRVKKIADIEKER
ncbi:MAG: ribose 5-phosphate isomerase B [Actinobacteria bacterium]|nr:ribose 5-phosphate isomerase B [Actinomycetota bacterium]